MKKIILICLFWITPMHAWYSPTLGWWSSSSALPKKEHDFTLSSLGKLFSCIVRKASVEDIDKEVAAICQGTKEFPEHQALIFKIMLNELANRSDDFGMKVGKEKNYGLGLSMLATGAVLAYGMYKYNKHTIHIVDNMWWKVSNTCSNYIVRETLRELLLTLEAVSPYIVCGGGIISAVLLVAGMECLSQEKYAEFYYEKYSLVYDRLQKGIDLYVDENNKVADYPLEECVYE